MQKLNSIADFTKFQQSLKARLSDDTPTIVVPAGTCGRASGAEKLIECIHRELLARRLTEQIGVRVTGCHGFCEMEPSVLVEPARTFYPKVDPSQAARLVTAVADGKVAADLLFRDPATKATIEKQDDIPFFRGQVRKILGRSERIDPTRIGSYISRGGYGALIKVFAHMQPEDVLREVEASGLRGRGGGGFPTGRKWRMLAGQPGPRGKILICNADEGDPGAYMDRSVLEGNPHSIIEGMLIGGFATGASEGVIYVRSEYPLAVKHLIVAITQARSLGLLGTNILGTGFSFDLQLVKGAGAFVCGEETALIRSVEGKMGEPRQRPPYPVQKGVDGKPTAINNVETWANIPIVIEEGAAEFAKIGTPGNTGTKIFSLVGKVPSTGLVEVPMGHKIGDLVRDIGGATAEAAIKAVQTGGPSGGCIPASLFDLRIDFDSLKKAGAIMGSGGMIVMDQGTCMVDVAKYFMAFLKDESCGKCFTCRKGIQRMHEILDDVSRGRGTIASMGLLEELALAVKDTAMCGLGQTAANPVLSTLKHFHEEYLAHIRDHRCPAGVCMALIRLFVNENCVGCQRCVQVCPVGAISGEKRKPHRIDTDKCTKCRACIEACRFKAIAVGDAAPAMEGADRHG